MATEEINIRIKTAIEASESAKSLGELKKSIKELSDLSNQVSGEQFLKVASAAGEAKDKMADLRENIGNLSGTPVEQLTKSFGSLKGALASGDFEQVGQQFKNMKTALFGVEGGFKGVGRAIALTGIGALVTAVVLLISNFDKLKDAGGFIGDMFTKVGAIIQMVIQKFKDLTDAIGLTDFAAQESAENFVKSQEKAMAAVDKRYKNQIELQKAAGKDTYDLEYQQLQDQLKLQQQGVSSRENITKEERDKYITGAIDTQQKIKVLEASHQKTLTDQQKKESDQRLKDQEANYQAQQQLDNARINSEKDSRDKSIKLEAESYETKIHNAKGNKTILEALEIEHRTNLAKINKEWDDKDAGAKKATDEKNYTEAVKKNEDDIKQQQVDLNTKYLAGEVTKGEFDTRQKQLEIDRLQGLKDVNETFSKDNVDTEVAISQAKVAIRDQDIELQSKTVEAKKKLDQEEAASKINTLSYIAQGIIAIGGLFGQNTVAAKAFAVAAATIDTYASITKTLSAFAGVPIPGYAIAQSIATGIAGFASVNRILNTQTPNPKLDMPKLPKVPGAAATSGSGGSSAGTFAAVSFRPSGLGVGGSGGGSQPNPSNFMTSGQGSQNPTPSTTKSNNRVYVLESDITNVQNKVNTIESRANLGS